MQELWPGDFTVTAQGKVVDKDTGELIHDATTVVITVTGSHLFRDSATWEVMFPAMSVVEIVVEAPGYESISFELKPHYKRNITIEVKIQLEKAKPSSDEA